MRMKEKTRKIFIFETLTKNSEIDVCFVFAFRFLIYMISIVELIDVFLVFPTESRQFLLFSENIDGTNLDVLLLWQLNVPSKSNSRRASGPSLICKDARNWISNASVLSASGSITSKNCPSSLCTSLNLLSCVIIFGNLAVNL